MYSVGFLFDTEFKRVALIKKERPNWQKGYLNGVGGKIEEGETALDCIIRETEEEFGILVENWNQFVTLVYKTEAEDIKVAVFRAVVADEVLNNITNMTDEQPFVVPVMDIHTGAVDAINNLNWLIPFAIWEPPTDEIVLTNCTQGYRWINNISNDNL